MKTQTQKPKTDNNTIARKAPQKRTVLLSVDELKHLPSNQPFIKPGSQVKK